MTDKRNKYKEKNKTLLQTLTFKVFISVYGGLWWLYKKEY